MMKRILIVVMVAGLTACASKDVKDEDKAPIEDKGAGTAVPGATPTPYTGGGVPAAPTGKAALKDPNNILSKRNVYFDFDSYIIKEEFKPLIQAHAKYLTDNKDARTTVQGNADDRGSREYNLALGQKRSEAVKKALIVLGVMEIQIEAVSFGEEKPVCTDQSENCWWKNRHGDIVYQGE